ncbi:MAG: DUF177 domain-containing protein [Erysipelothrix sp.]|nr:DUF177 domain-containing protein [Erysipelothrix sp.]
MKLHRYDLEDMENPYLQISQEIVLDETVDTKHERYLEIKDIYVEGSGFYDSKTSEFIVGLDIECVVIVPCAISLVPVEIEVNGKLSESFVFFPERLPEDDREVLWVESDELDMWPLIWSEILSEIPLRVVDPTLEAYPTGNGWAVLTEEDYQKEKEQEIDPRLAKLMDFKFNNGGE